MELVVSNVVQVKFVKMVPVQSHVQQDNLLVMGSVWTFKQTPRTVKLVEMFARQASSAYQVFAKLSVQHHKKNVVENALIQISTLFIAEIAAMHVPEALFVVREIVKASSLTVTTVVLVVRHAQQQLTNAHLVNVAQQLKPTVAELVEKLSPIRTTVEPVISNALVEANAL